MISKDNDNSMETRAVNDITECWDSIQRLTSRRYWVSWDRDPLVDSEPFGAPKGDNANTRTMPRIYPVYPLHPRVREQLLSLRNDRQNRRQKSSYGSSGAKARK